MKNELINYFQVAGETKFDFNSQFLFNDKLKLEFLDSVFIISCCYFQHSLSTKKEFNLIPIVNLWNVMHATLLSSVVAPATPETKKIQPESV